MKKLAFVLSAFASLSSLHAQAIFRDELLKRDLVCWNDLRELKITQDFGTATVTEGFQSRTLKISVSHLSGGNDQAVIFTISGMDGLHMDSTLINRFKLDGGGQSQIVRSKQAGYGSTTIESFTCKYAE